MFTNAKSPPHCILMTSHLRNRIIADGAHFELRLHLIYLTNDVLHHWWAMQYSAKCLNDSTASPSDWLKQDNL